LAFGHNRRWGFALAYYAQPAMLRRASTAAIARARFFMKVFSLVMAEAEALLLYC
jgi:hypothetical protein